MEFLYRTEDIKTEEILKYFVATKEDREIITALKGRNPVILVGSRGVGKSFLLRVAEAELMTSFPTDRVYPLYVTFSRSSLIQTNDPVQFQHWMLARICDRLIRSLGKSGMLLQTSRSLSILSGGNFSTETLSSRISTIVESYETSWKTPKGSIDVSGIPSIEDFNDAIEDICGQLSISRIVVFIDEAAHILLSEQQRQFFTLFRDLRSPFITCNAAIYPGVTAFGDTFQASHDATMRYVNRNILSQEYISNMREIVEKQSADSAFLQRIATNEGNFSVLAYAASGNPRLLLKTLDMAPKLDSRQINEVVREFYRTDIWSEHSGLAAKFPGYSTIIDWGRRFIESHVLPDLNSKNVKYLAEEKNSSCFFWIHKDTPQIIKEALRLLAYTGIVTEHANGIRATRSEIGTRYMINLGCLLALESLPTNTGLNIAKSLTVKRMTEFGVKHRAYQELLGQMPSIVEPDMYDVLKHQLEKSIDELDIRPWQRDGLKQIEVNTIGEILTSSEAVFQRIPYVGPVRARQIANAAFASVFEYLSG